jgi:hypothetical protein
VDPGFQVRGGALKKIGVFRVKNHDFTPKKSYFSILGGARNFWDISCEKNHDFTPKNHIFSNCGGRRKTFWGIR